MRIKRFRIKNYRSIEDTDWCYLSPDMTILAGKNEAGKTSILEALRDFSKDEEIHENAIPIGTEKTPEISVSYVIPGSKRTIFYSEEDLDDIKVTVTKTQGGYEVDERIIAIFPGILEKREEVADEIYNQVSDIRKDIEHRLGEEGLVSVAKEDQFRVLKESIDKIISYLENKISETDNQNLKDVLKDHRSELEELSIRCFELSNLDGLISGGYFEFIPNFILFDSVDDKIPNKISLSDLSDNEFVQNLSKISDLDIELLQKNGFSRKKKTHKKEVNINLNEDYEEFWTQDASKLNVDWDSKQLEFWIEEDNSYYEPSIRSKGKQWHLSFYIKLTAHAEEENPPIVLIDDPGIHLHKTAQKDILRKLEDLGQYTDVLFTTHSPYLIDPNKLNRLRLVEKRNKKTEVNKVHSGADMETLSPILTAIGAAPNMGVRGDKKNTIVVEGISDYYYLQGFREIQGIDQELNLVPAVGDINMKNIGAILFGWGTDPIFCLDDDSENGVEEDLKDPKKLGIDEEKIIKVNEEGGAIEDTFSKSDFARLVLDDSEKEFKSKNSVYMGKAQKSKALASKMFYERVLEENNIDIDEETQNNIENIFDKLDDAKEKPLISK